MPLTKVITELKTQGHQGPQLMPSNRKIPLFYLCAKRETGYGYFVLTTNIRASQTNTVHLGCLMFARGDSFLVSSGITLDVLRKFLAMALVYFGEGARSKPLRKSKDSIVFY